LTEHGLTSPPTQYRLYGRRDGHGRCIWDRHFAEREVMGGGGQRWYHSKERCWFFIGSPLWPLRYLLYSAAIYHRMSATLKSTHGGSLWGKIWGGRGDRFFQSTKF